MNLSAELDRWLEPETREVLVRVGSCAASLGFRAFLVGGPVRDLLLGRTSLDFDVVVEGDALAVATAVAAPGEPAAVTHPAFGTATISAERFRIDLASARAETYERPGSLPVVRPGTIKQDLVRRDFTINAMALTLDGGHRGELLDLYGGRDDLKRGLLRVLHDNSFVDDATRIVRGVRYEQRFGFTFETHTLELLRTGLPYLDCISPDRVRHELERTFAEDEPEQAFARLDTLGVLGAIHSALSFDRQKETALMQARTSVFPSTRSDAVKWCLLTWGMSAAGIDSLSARLNLPRRVRDAAASAAGLLLLEPRLDNPLLSRSDLFALLHGFSHSALLAAELMFVLPAARAHVALYIHHLCHVRCALTGVDLRALGVSDGPEMGRILDCLRDARLNDEIASRADELNLARRLCDSLR